MTRRILLTVILILIAVPLTTLALQSVSTSSGFWLAQIARTVLGEWLLNSGVTAFGACAIAITLGWIPAWITHRYEFPGRGLFSFLALYPLMTPPHALAGLFTEVPLLAGLDRLAIASLALGCSSSPYAFLLLRVALGRISPQYDETAQALGHHICSRVRHVFLPLLGLPLIFGALVAWVDGIGDYGVSARLGVSTLTVGFSDLWTGLQNTELAIHLSLLILLATVAAIGLIIWPFFTRAWNNPPHTSRTTSRTHPPNRWTLTGVSLALAIPGTFIPAFFTALWATEKISRIRLTSLATDAAQSLLTASATVIVVLIIGIVIIFLARLGSKLHPLEGALTLSLVNYAVPTLVLAVAFFTLTAESTPWSNLVAPWRDTRMPIVLASATRFLPLLLLPLLDALCRFPVHTLETSQSLGNGPYVSRLLVVIPQIKIPLLVGIFLVFIESMKELTLSLALQPFGYHAISLRIFSYTGLNLAKEASVWILANQIILFYPVLRIFFLLEDFNAAKDISQSPRGHHA